MLSPNPDLFRTAYQQITPAERAFVDRIVRDMAESARRFGRPVGDAIDATIPHELIEQDRRGWLQRPLVIAAVTERISELQHYDDVSIDTVIRQLHAIATFDLTEVLELDDFGEPAINLTNLTPDQRAALEAIDIDKTDGVMKSTRTKIKIKAHSKIAALKQLAELLGGTEAANSYIERQRTINAPRLNDQTTIDGAADQYQKFIGE